MTENAMWKHYVNGTWIFEQKAIMSMPTLSPTLAVNPGISVQKEPHP